MKLNQHLNRLKYNASLEKIVQTKDEYDRPITAYQEVRILKYGPMGITTSDKDLGATIQNDITHKIECRLDYDVVDYESNHRVVIRGIRYKIARIYVDVANRRMELSLYADNNQSAS